jgi:hypothetical protein
MTGQDIDPRGFEVIVADVGSSDRSRMSHCRLPGDCGMPGAAGRGPDTDAASGEGALLYSLWLFLDKFREQRPRPASQPTS